MEPMVRTVSLIGSLLLALFAAMPAVIFYGNDDEKRQAEASKRSLEQSGRFKKPIVTQIERASQFYAAEDYHQDFAEKNPIRYGLYKAACGRADRLAELWGKS